ncbi:isochorismatase family protein, partial [Pseudomonas sp. 3A(2025)]
LLVEKSHASAFQGTNLGDWLIEQQIDTLSVAGYMTQNCDNATIQQAVHRGLAVEFLSDATGAVSYRNRAGSVSAEEVHRVISAVLQAAFAAVLSTDEWVEALQSGKSPVRENIYTSTRL